MTQKLINKNINIIQNIYVYNTLKFIFILTELDKQFNS